MRVWPWLPLPTMTMTSRRTVRPAIHRPAQHELMHDEVITQQACASHANERDTHGQRVWTPYSRLPWVAMAGAPYVNR